METGSTLINILSFPFLIETALFLFSDMKEGREGGGQALTQGARFEINR